MRTQFICALVIVMRRSSGSFGRIEIKSSSEDNQFMAFSARSRFPLNRRNELAAHCELPTTTNRPCEFSLLVLYDPAAAIVSGPFLFFGSLGSTLGEFNFVVASNERAVRLWQRMGFAIIGRTPDAFQHPAFGFTDALVMFRKL